MASPNAAGAATAPKIAYFSMEIGLESSLPTYSGGLGVLAGDTIRSAADLKVPMVAVSLLYRKGYFYQRLDAAGRQTEEAVEWNVDDFLLSRDERVTVTIEGRPVSVRCWRYDVRGAGGFLVPVFFLDTDIPENAEPDRRLTHYLYGGDSHYRLCQEVILGVAGVRMLRALGFDQIERFHMNEGHASLLTLELLAERLQADQRTQISPADIDAVHSQCVFTTHTPVVAGHDKFPVDLARQVLGDSPVFALPKVFCCDDQLNMTYLALNLSHYVNGVAKKHGEVSRHMFAPYLIDSITNGVHLATWASEPIQALFDRYIPGWRQDNFSLRYALNIPPQELWEAHQQAKRHLFQQVNRENNSGMDLDVLTVGFARRAAAYKRADLLFFDLDRLRNLAGRIGPLQIIYAGKAHPRDEGGKELIHRIFQAKEALKADIRIAYLANYDMDLSRCLTAGADLWLNTPEPPMEASGTSGMKAALNGVPSLSILDGWWIEGCIENVTGWAIGALPDAQDRSRDRQRDAGDLYDKLEQVVVPLYYQNRSGYLEIMRHAAALNGSFFNTQRMMQQYVLRAYFR
ncbi:MAG: alpha-glucan family phosphorylase [Sedimentisphaerales bacterium]|nr:alpha-glucan family phosphorylase [Sedimentisphaerales bacterium]